MEEQKSELFCPKREPAPIYVGYRAQKPDGGSFRLHIVLSPTPGISGSIGCDAVLLTTGETGEIVSALLKGKKYKAEFTFSGLPANLPEGFELLVRPYATDSAGIRAYGRCVRLFFRNQTDKKGYPILSVGTVVDRTVKANDSTYIFFSDGQCAKPVLLQKRLQVRNPGDENTALYRAAYFRFTLGAKDVAMLSTAVSAQLRVYVDGSFDSEGTRRRYPMTVYATAADWNENTLTYDSRENFAADEKRIASFSYTDKTYLVVDILAYLKEKKPAADGSLTVSFRFTNEGHEDALLTYLASRISDFAPVIRISESLFSHEPELEKVKNDGYEPWGYAEKLTDEWFGELVDRIFPRDANGNVTEHEIRAFSPVGYDGEVPCGDFTVRTDWRKGTDWKPTDTEAPTGRWESRRYVRTLDTVGNSSGKRFLDTPFATQKTEYDRYGYPANAGFTGTATGFFHTERIGERFYLIDPLGNPGFAVGINTFTLGDSQNLKNYALERYGDTDTYFDTVTKRLKDMGVNAQFGGDFDELLKKEPDLPTVVSIGVVGPYMNSLGLSTQSESYRFAANNTMNVFDPDFVTSTRRIVSGKIEAGGYVEMANLLGYTTDNELPSGTDILERYLLVDPQNPYNSFSYAVAWTWLSKRLGKLNPTLDDLLCSPEHAQMNSEFLAFIFARIYGVAGEAIHQVDPNHMYFGSRVNDICRTDKNYLRVAGYFLDVISVNLYGGLNPDAKTLTDFYRYSGKPFIVTEFYAKAKDSVDANGYPLANPTGAGILVKTQKARADYYEHYTLALIESGAAVGWAWYRLRDNDQGLYRSVGKENVLYMLSVNYNTCRANTYMEANGRVLTADEAGEVEPIYIGEPIASNQSVNKGFFNCRLDSAVTLYRYDGAGILLGAETFPVKTPDSPIPAEGMVLTSVDGKKTFTVGRKDENGITTETVLTVFDGQYVALCDSVKAISNHIIGLVRYFDENNTQKERKYYES